MIRTAASLAGMTLVFGLVLYLAYGSGNDGGADATPTPSAAAVAAPTDHPQLTPPNKPTPTPAASPPNTYLAGDLTGTSVIQLRQGDPIDLPNDVALIIETGCWQCDGPTTGLDRVYRDPSGKIRTQTLVSAELLGITNDSGNPPVILGFDALDDASLIVVAFCTAGDCGWLGVPDANAHTTFFESTDGGVTWTQIADLAGLYRLVSLIPADFYSEPDVLVSGPFPTDPEAPYEPRFSYLRAGVDIVPPSEAGDFPQPWIAPSGGIFWQGASSRLFTSAGEPFFYVGAAAYLAGNITSDLSGTRWGIPWGLPTGNGPALQFLTLVDETGHIVRSLQYDRYVSYGANSNADVMYGNAELDPDLLVGDLQSPNFTFLPAEIHLNEGVFYPILDPFTGKRFNFGRNRVVAVQTGPFARVVNTDGSCVNVRAPAGLSEMIFDCVAEGVLLHDTHEHTTVDGIDWTRIVTFDGLQGWVASDYLESDTVVQYIDR